jgi:hypothetical protein
MALAVDHAVINVQRDMDAAVARFDALGFTLTPRGHHSLGSINHLMVFERDYLELVGLPSGDGPVRREIADAPVGLNGLVFAIADIASLHRTLAARGVPAQPPLAFDRPVDIDGIARRAAFRTVRVDADYLVGGRVYFCEHVTPDLVWRPEWQAHRNGVHALAGMTIVVPSPAEQAARYRDLGGEHLAAARSGDDMTLAFDAFRLRVTTAERYRAHYGALACDAGGRDAFMGALALRTRALGHVRACLDAASLWESAERSPDRITLRATAAFNTVLEFLS